MSKGNLKQAYSGRPADYWNEDATNENYALIANRIITISEFIENIQLNNAHIMS